MVAGELVAEGSPSGIKAGSRATCSSSTSIEPQRAADRLKTTMERWRVSLFGDRLHVIVDDAADGQAERDRHDRWPRDGIAICRARESRDSRSRTCSSASSSRHGSQGKVAPED